MQFALPVAYDTIRYIVPLCITFVVSFVAAISAHQRGRSTAARMLLLFASAVMIWSAGYICEFLAVGEAAKLFWAKVQYLGIVLAPISFVFFVQVNLGFEENVHWQNVIVAGVVPLITLLAAFTNNLEGGFLWENIRLSTTHPGLDFDHGAIFYLIIAYSYLMLLIGCYYVFRAFRADNLFRRRQALILFLAVLPPWVGNFLYVLDLTPSGLDLTPIAFAVTGILLWVGFIRFHFLEILPIARNRVIESLRDALLVVDLNWRVVDVNEAAEKLLKSSRNQLLTRDANDLLKRWSITIADMALEEGPSALIHETINDRARVLSLALSILTNKNEHDVQGRVITFHDITQQQVDAQKLREGETRLRAMVTRLQELDELKSRFIRTINHELRTPLTNIALYVDLLRSGKRENFDRYLAVVERQTAILRRLIEQTLELDRMDQLATEGTAEQGETNLNKVIEHATTSMARQATLAGITLNQELPGEEIIIQGEQERLEHMLVELLANAINFTTRGGSVEVRLARNGHHALLSVRDSGVGIPPNDQEHIFERFFRGEQALLGHVPGLGLGLTSVKSIAEQHGGAISVDSELGKGSTFTVSLPLSPHQLSNQPNTNRSNTVKTDEILTV